MRLLRYRPLITLLVTSFHSPVSGSFSSYSRVSIAAFWSSLVTLVVSLPDPKSSDSSSEDCLSPMRSLSFYLEKLMQTYNQDTRTLYSPQSQKSVQQKYTLLSAHTLTEPVVCHFGHFVSSVRSSNSHPDLLVINTTTTTPLFQIHTGPQHWTFTF